MIYVNAIPKHNSDGFLVVGEKEICCYECYNYKSCSLKFNLEIPVKILCSDFDSIMED